MVVVIFQIVYSNFSASAQKNCYNEWSEKVQVRVAT